MILPQNKNKKMKEFLLQIYKISKKLDEDITRDTVYYHLTRGNIPASDRSFRIDKLFPKFIDNFRNNFNTKAFVAPNWRYFCQFVNMKNSEKKNLSNAIKMYLSVGSKDIENIANIIFSFMDKNGIIHESKIGSEIRSDDIVIRVYSKEDEKLISNFINSNNYVKKSLKPQIPFCFENNGIGYALDREISFNVTVSLYVTNYINDCKKNKQKVSLDGFYNYVFNIYKSVFIDKKGIDEYAEKYMSKDLGYYESDFLLNNYYEVTKLLLTSIKSNNFEDYMNLVDEFNDPKRYENRLNYFGNSEISEKDVLLFNEYIITMVKKYGIDNGLSTVEEYIQTGNIMNVTSTNNLRVKFASNMNHNKCLQILNGINVKEYYDKLIHKEEKHNQEYEYKKAILDKAILTTYRKYGYDQTITALITACSNGNYNFFTNDFGARERLFTSLSQEDINTITNGDLVNYLQEVVSIIDSNSIDNSKKI